MFNKNLLKSSFLLTLTLMEKVEDDEGNSTLKVINTLSEKTSRTDFIYDINEDAKAGIEHSFEIVYKKPENFQLNKIYILADGTRMWIYLEKDMEKLEEEEKEPTLELPNES